MTPDPGRLAEARTRVLAQSLAGRLPPPDLVTDPAITTPYGTDWTRRWQARPLAVARPRSHDQVTAVLAACAEQRIPVVPQGGNTGLVGGSVPQQDDAAVVCSLRGLAGPPLVDASLGEVVVDAGVTLAAVQAAARAHGWRYGVDLAARDSATIGGTVATNAGGVRVVRDGTTRDQLLGVRAVLADGSTLDRLHDLAADGAGYDLTRLLCGSEGTLAVLTAVRLRLLPPEPPGHTILLGCPHVDAAVSLLPSLRAAGLRLAELMLDDGMRLVQQVSGLPAPLRQRWPVYLLAQTDALPDLPETMEAAVDDRLLAYRERHPEAVATLGVVVKLDVAVPPPRLSAVLAALPAAAAPHRVLVFGHLAAGNLHVQLVPTSRGPDVADAEVAVTDLVLRHGGSVAAEHGVGAAKTTLLPRQRSAVELRLLASVKAAFDPTGLLNPGVVLQRRVAADADASEHPS
jgi:FAD/FMN-containing dehydrogenase